MISFGWAGTGLIWKAVPALEELEKLAGHITRAFIYISFHCSVFISSSLLEATDGRPGRVSRPRK